MNYRRRKRLFDLGLALPAAILSLPVVLLLSLGSAISFRAWPFFVQKRLGQDGREFRFIKLRSLPASAPTAVDKYALREVENTRWGRSLRKTKLDELPQLWLVVWGTMSLVGPRPEMPELAARFDPEFVAERVTVKPGCTGLWQISEASAGLIGESTVWDLVYVRNRSCRLDLWILAQTLRSVVTGRTLKSIERVPGWANLPRKFDSQAFEAA